MNRTRRVIGKAPDLVYEVTDEPLPNGGYRTLSIEGPIRRIPGRLPVAGNYRSEFDHHGHLIADLFGGPGNVDSGNVVAMHGYVNNGAGGEYREMERAVLRLLGDRKAMMRVDVRYHNPTEIRPHLFDVQVWFSNGMRSRWKIFNFYSHLPNPFRVAR